MHMHQADNLLVLHGARHIELWSPSHGAIERFTVTPQRVEHNDTVVCDGPALVGWPCGVYHRIVSHETEGSASLNVAVRYEGFDIKTNYGSTSRVGAAEVQFSLVPEPATLGLLALGSLVALRRRRR